MAEHRPIVRRAAFWIGWGVAAAAAYLIALPLFAGGLVVVPIAIVAYEDGLVEAAISCAAGILTLLLLGGGLNLSALAILLAGLPLGTLLRQQRDALRTAGATFLLSLAGIVGLFLLPAQYGGVMALLPPAELSSLLRILAANGIHFRTLKELLGLLLPAFAPVYAGMITLEAFFITRMALGHRRHQLPEVRPFWLWVAPAWLPPLYLVAMAIQLVIGVFGGSSYGQLNEYAWLVSLWTGVPLLFIGLAVMDHWLLRMRLPQPTRGILLVLAGLLPILTQLLTWLGVLDGVFDIRRFRQEQG